MSTRYLVALEAAGGLRITRELSLGSEKIICFTKFSQGDGQWLIGASEGVTIWRVGLSEDDLKELSDGKDEVTFLNDICHTLQNGEVEVLKPHNHLKLVLKCTSKEMDLMLYETSAAERKLEIKTLMFSLWDSLKTTKSRLEVCEKDLLDMQKSRYDSTGGCGELTIGTAGTSKAVAARPKKTKGASLVNPNTKRRKVATGVVFDADS